MHRAPPENQTAPGMSRGGDMGLMQDEEILDGIERDIERLEADLRRKPPYTIAHHLLLKGIEHGTRH
jgi:hypothetical protein